MKFFKKKQTVTVTFNAGGNPASRKLADATVAKLQEFGIDINAAAKCMGEFGKSTTRYFRKMQPYARENRSFDHLLVEWTDELKATLTEAGISDISKQEEIILEYMDIIEASC